MPASRRSTVSPIALVNSQLPSPSITTLSPALCSLPQAFITKASLTDRQAIVSTPLPFKAAAFCT